MSACVFSEKEVYSNEPTGSTQRFPALSRGTRPPRHHSTPCTPTVTVITGTGRPCSTATPGTPSAPSAYRSITRRRRRAWRLGGRPLHDAPSSPPDACARPPPPPPTAHGHTPPCPATTAGTHTRTHPPVVLDARSSTERAAHCHARTGHRARRRRSWPEGRTRTCLPRRSVRGNRHRGKSPRGRGSVRPRPGCARGNDGGENAGTGGCLAAATGGGRRAPPAKIDNGTRRRCAPSRERRSSRPSRQRTRRVEDVPDHTNAPPPAGPCSGNAAMTVDDDAPSSVPVDLVVAVDIMERGDCRNVDARDATRNPAAAAGAPMIVHGWTRGIVEDVQRFPPPRGARRTRASAGELGTGSAPKWVATTATVGGSRGPSARGGYESPRVVLRQVLTRRVHRDANRPDARERAEVPSPAGVASWPPPRGKSAAAAPPSIAAGGVHPRRRGGFGHRHGDTPKVSIPSSSILPRPRRRRFAVGVRGIVAGVSDRRSSRIRDEDAEARVPQLPEPRRDRRLSIRTARVRRERRRGRFEEHIAAGEGDGSPRTTDPGRGRLEPRRGEVDDGVVGVEKSWRVDAPLPPTPTPRKP